MWKVLSFEWILLLKIKTNFQKMCFEGKMNWMCSHLGGNNTCYHIYPWRNVVCFVLFCRNDIFPNHDVLSYAIELIIKNISMNRGASTWFQMFGAIVWNILIIGPFFYWFFWKTKIENYIGIWGYSWYCWKALTKFDLIKLIL